MYLHFSWWEGMASAPHYLGPDYRAALGFLSDRLFPGVCFAFECTNTNKIFSPASDDSREADLMALNYARGRQWNGYIRSCAQWTFARSEAHRHSLQWSYVKGCMDGWGMYGWMKKKSDPNIIVHLHHLAYMPNLRSLIKYQMQPLNN